MSVLTSREIHESVFEATVAIAPKLDVAEFHERLSRWSDPELIKSVDPETVMIGVAWLAAAIEKKIKW